MEIVKMVTVTYCVVALVMAGGARGNNVVVVGDAPPISCFEAIARLMPCAVFLSGPARTPSLGCCFAASNLDTRASSTATRRSVCECFKRAAPTYGIKVDKAMQLPQLCNNPRLPVPVDPKINCTSI